MVPILAFSNKDAHMPFANNAPTIKEMLAAVDAGTATVAEATAIVNQDASLARAKADAGTRRYNTLAAKFASGEAVVAQRRVPRKLHAVVPAPAASACRLHKGAGTRSRKRCSTPHRTRPQRRSQRSQAS